MSVSAVAVDGLPEIEPGADLAGMIAAAAGLRDGDVVAVAHKAVSKAEGRIRRLADVEPGPRARALAARHHRDPRTVQVVLDEAVEVVAERPGVLVCLTRHGYVCANAGVDASNAPQPGTLVLLPLDPDASARALRARLRQLTGARVAVLVTDSFGRAWRRGQCDVAIGCAGLVAVDDRRGRADAAGRPLRATAPAVADQAAAAADLARAKDSRQPVVVVRGLAGLVCDEDGPGAAVALVRPAADDLFRRGAWG